MVRSTVRRASFVPQVLLGLTLVGGLYIFFTLPPRSARIPSSPDDPRTVAGAYHVHTDRSDGTGSADEVAAAAARAGLQFVITADHTDVTRAFDPPTYRHGVLCIDAAEVSTGGGHIVALGLGRSSPYPVAGEPRDVIEDIHRLGGWAVAAHPDSPKEELRWRDWNLPIEGVEWLNLDSEWRDESAAHLVGSFARYLVRGPESITSLLTRPVQTLRRWDAIGRVRPLVGLAATDAHARLSLRTSKQGRDRTLAALPGYAPIFRTISQVTLLERPLTGDAATDASLLLEALRAGRTYSVVTGIASPGRLTFTATQGAREVRMGESLEPSAVPARLHADVNDAASQVRLVHNGVEIASGRGRVDLSAPMTAGPYRVEAYRPGIAMPWIVSNPIFVGAASAPADAVFRTSPTEAVASVRLPSEAGWGIEHSPTSTGAAVRQGSSVQFSFALGPGPALDQFAALVTAVDAAHAGKGFDRVEFVARSDRAMRFSVQVRLPGGGPDGRRWRQSVYADETPRRVVLSLQDFQPAEGNSSQRPIVAHVRSVLFVVDTLNAFPGTKGSIALADVSLGIGNPGQ